MAREAQDQLETPTSRIPHRIAQLCVCDTDVGLLLIAGSIFVTHVPTEGRGNQRLMHAATARTVDRVCFPLPTAWAEPAADESPPSPHPAMSSSRPPKPPNRRRDLCLRAEQGRWGDKVGRTTTTTAGGWPAHPTRRRRRRRPRIEWLVSESSSLQPRMCVCVFCVAQFDATGGKRAGGEGSTAPTPMLLGTWGQVQNFVAWG